MSKVTDFAKCLRAYNDSQSSAAAAAASTSEDDEVPLIFAEIRRSEQQHDRTLTAIPRFYTAAKSPLQLALKKEARTRFLDKQLPLAPDVEDIDALCERLLQLRNPLSENASEHDNGTISYDKYVLAGQQLSDKWAPYFKASTFVRFKPDENGNVPIESIYHYFSRKANLQLLRIALTRFDVVGKGYLREQDLDKYIYQLIPTFKSRQPLPDPFYRFYLCGAVRKFFFFLDPSRKGKISIRDLLVNPISPMEELLELRGELSEEDEARNWFSSKSALRVYTQYLHLDMPKPTSPFADGNGMLRAEELQMYGARPWGPGGIFRPSLTRVFVDCLFQEYFTYRSPTLGCLEMDYKTYLDFVLAMENKKTPQALQYFFRVLDIKKQGYLTVFELTFFFREVLKMLEQHRDQRCGSPDHDGTGAADVPAEQELPKLEDVKDEIFDMVKPADPAKITLQDLVECGVGHTVVTMLTDAYGFMVYENRELILAENEGSEPGVP
eukprot:gnl/Spiro4/13708_TR7304_c0_g1_i1.p1 gnl/Spiro4/13708_TR7304_c0_g1~~gnl/Spiro4/13708_TR7304_c0_g1_i1.p1  ORF type:complete len:496 (+),score=239.27 gnl/Spiro4/13708_TR7304_c0_g1_i1:32-1519(+)